VTTVDTPLYRFTVLGTAAMRMWRGWRIVLPVVVINAVVQGVLLLPGGLPYLTAGFILTAVASFVVLAASFTLVSASMLQAVEGAVSTHSTLAALRTRIWPVLAWSLGLVAVVTVGLALYVIPGLVVLAVTPYLLIAVVDRARNPLATNFRVLRARWGRWLVTIAIVAFICLLMWLLSALDGFFVTGSGGAIIGWLGIGLVSSWLICAWTLVYRSVVPPTHR
jgi:hypothetical protein